MNEVFIGSEALTNGALTRAQLRWNYRAIFPDIYSANTVAASLRRNTFGAWLWSGRQGVITGRAAAAIHGAMWVDAATPVEMIGRWSRSPNGIIVRNERIEADEIVEVAGLPVTTPQRTAFDVARRLPRDVAVAHLDALARATEVKASDVLLIAERYPRARGLPRSRIALDLMEGLERRSASRMDTTRRFSTWATVHGIGRAELVDRQGWIDILVVAEHSRRYVLHRVKEAFARRNYRV